MNTKQKNGLTKTGFSRAGFASRSHFKECVMGKLTCYYEEIDSEVKTLCSCYQRHHNLGTYSRHSITNEICRKETKQQILDSKRGLNDEMEQLSLF